MTDDESMTLIPSQWSQLNRSWDDPVRGGWWKSLVIIASYFILRISLEGRLLLGYMLDGGFPETAEDAMIMTTRALGEQSGQYLLLSLALLAFLLLMLRLFKMKLFDLRSVTKQGVFFVLKLYAIMWVLSFAAQLLIEWLAPSFVTSDNQAALIEMARYSQPLLLSLTLAVVIPITEEIIFRGLLMKYFSPLMPTLGALISFVTFVYAHGARSWMEWLIYGVLAAGLVYAYWRTRKLEYSIMIHIIQNTIAVIGMYLIDL